MQVCTTLLLRSIAFKPWFVARAFLLGEIMKHGSLTIDLPEFKGRTDSDIIEILLILEEFGY